MESRALSYSSSTQPEPESPELGTSPKARSVWLSREAYQRVAEPTLLLYAATAALSVALTQIFLIPLVLYWLLVVLAAPGEERKELRSLWSSSGMLVQPIAAWFGICVLSGLWGADPVHSLIEAGKGLVFLLLPFATASAFAWSESSPESFQLQQTLSFAKRLLAALLVGQTIAALHSVLSLGVGIALPEKIPGAVTESGQLVLLLPILFGQVLLLLRERLPLGRGELLSLSGSAIFSGVLLVLCWPLAQDAQHGHGLLKTLAFGTSLASTLFLVFRFFRARKELFSYFRNSVPTPRRMGIHLFSASAILLGATFLFNLKRGPWLAVFLEIIFLGLLFSRKFAIGAVTVGVLALLFLAPVRNRLLDSADDFSIQGGRQNMWTMGSDLVRGYPVGIGFANSRLMRKLDPTLPERHRHMHNNILQVTVETGWLGLSIYLWWMGSAIALGFRSWKALKKTKDPILNALAMILICCSTALFGWQCAGVVEYNFGDAEIRLIAFLYMGILLGIIRQLRSGKVSV